MDDYDGYGQFTGCLLFDEHLVWKGRPVKGHVFSQRDIFMIPFSIVWGGFAIFWEVSAVVSGAPVFFCLWGIPFVLVGLYMIAGRFFVQQYMRGITYYAVTDRRVLISRGGKISSLNRSCAPEMHMTVNRDGSGTIMFGNVRSNAYGYWWTYHGSAQQDMNGFALENIPDVNQVYRLLMGVSPQAI
ncbi:hypothetical protein V1224_04875 [Lachnospiraceae bacterium JLR.KK008]